MADTAEKQRQKFLFELRMKNRLLLADRLEQIRDEYDPKEDRAERKVDREAIRAEAQMPIGWLAFGVRADTGTVDPIVRKRRPG